ncbi:MAG: 50S ribosomal protein L29 [Pseudomonadota bacterium]
MKAAELREMNGAGLQDELLKLRREQFNLRMQRATGQEVQQNDLRRVRRDIARIKTVMAETANAADVS